MSDPMEIMEENFERLFGKYNPKAAHINGCVEITMGGELYILGSKCIAALLRGDKTRHPQIINEHLKCGMVDAQNLVNKLYIH